MKEIYAISHPNVVLDNNKPKRIGSISDYSHFYSADRRTINYTKIELDYEQNGVLDEFFFEKDKLVFSSVSNQREKYMKVVYRDFVAREELTLEQFLTAIKEAYVFYALGFANMPPKE